MCEPHWRGMPGATGLAIPGGEHITERDESTELRPLRSRMTWGNGGPYSGSLYFADEDEVPGSSPGRPTTPRLTGGIAAERFLVLARLSASWFGMRSTGPTSLRSCTALLGTAFVRRLGSAEWCAGPHGGGRAHPLATVASKRSAARRSVGSGRSGQVLAGVVGAIACDAIDRGFRGR
jgi:hypothetical protein